MTDFLRFMASPTGRGIRIAAGLALAAAGIANRNKPNWALLGISVVPLSAGLFDLCILAPFDGKPVDGNQLRRMIGQ